MQSTYLGMLIATLGSTAIIAAAVAGASAQGKPAPLVIQEQGSFAVGGTMTQSPGTFDPYKPAAPAGQTYRGDHAYVFYQIPVDARKLPLVLWHGAGQFSKTWETTPDGREGYQNIFLRRGFGVYVIDQPRRGNAGRSMVQSTIAPTPDEQLWFGMFRIGLWPSYFPGVQFSKDPETLNQYFRSMTPNTGPFDVPVITDAVSALFDKVGPGILVTHSQSGGPGWVTAMKNPKVRAVVAGARSDAERDGPARRRRGAARRLPEAHEDSDRRLLRRQYPRAAHRQPHRGQLARPPRNGAALARRREPTRRRRHAGPPSRDRDPRQHAFPVLGSQQCADRRPDVGISQEEGARLIVGAN
jgi:hypothetical protein